MTNIFMFHQAAFRGTIYLIPCDIPILRERFVEIYLWVVDGTDTITTRGARVGLTTNS